jgi:chemotaxis protein methyltransferase CheR
MLALTDVTFKRVSEIMYASIGLSFSESKKPLISSRLASRIQKIGLNSFEDYVEILEDQTQAVEFQMAVDLLTTNETYFFREPKHYELLEKELIARKSRTPLAIWSAASSFGDEAYSTAMLLSDMQRKGQIGADWSVLGTDISHRVLLSATEAVYPLDRLRYVPPEQMRRYCLEGEGAASGQVMMQDALRSHVQFGQLNLTKEISGLGPFDVVFLRNVLIYFDAPTKIAVVDRVLSTLRPNGLFFLGTAEGRVSCATPLQAILPGAYRKVA